jgi:hypothetical protein
MKRLLLAACLLALAAPASAEPGVSLAWGEQCWTDNPVDSRTFACDTNAGVEYATGSFELGEALPGFWWVEIIVDVCSGSNELPDWWQLWNAGSCRATSLSAISGAASANCVSPWQGEVAGGIGAYQTLHYPPPVGDVPLPNAGRIKFGFVMMPEARPTLSRSVEYLAFRLAINHQKTVGDDACAGCEVPLELIVNQIIVGGDSSV